MDVEPIDDPPAFFRNLGGLHDSRITAILVSHEAQELVLDLDDLHANFEGLPEDPGRRPIRLLFRAVKSMAIELRSGEPITVIDVDTVATDSTGVSDHAHWTTSFVIVPRGRLEVVHAHLGVQDRTMSLKRP